MAFPVVESVTPTLFGTAATAHLVVMPAVVNAGDLLTTVFANAGNTTVTTPTGWTQLDTTQASTTVRLGSYYRIADGTEDGVTVDFVTAGAVKAVAHVYRHSAWHGTTPPEVGIAATGSSTTPDSPNLIPSWGAVDTGWLALTGTGAGNPTVSAYPTSYTNGNDDAAGGASSSAIGSARRELNAASDDPAVFTLSASAVWVAQTLAIRPAAAVGGGSSANLLLLGVG